MHEFYNQRLDQLTRDLSGTSLSGTSRVSHEVLGQVLTGLRLAAPGSVVRDELRVELGISPATMNKAVGVLERAGLVSRRYPPASGPGRPVEPLVIGSDVWATVGVRISREADRAFVTGAVVGLDGQPVAPFENRQAPLSHSATPPPDGQVADEVAAFVADLVTEWRNQAPTANRRLLGVGFEVSGHVHDGCVIRADHTGWRWRDSNFADLLAARINTLLGACLDLPVPVVLENDVNLLAIHESYNHTLPDDAAIVAVYDEGAGGALLLNGFLYRGAHGMAGEIGHLPVAGLQPPPPALVNAVGERPSPPGFSDPCQCSDPDTPRYGHVDCYATPARILGELTNRTPAGEDLSFDAVATQLACDDTGTPTAEGDVFQTAGNALGLALVSLIHTVNPALMIYLPPALASAAPGDGTAAGAYRQAMDEVVQRHAFSTGYTNALLLHRTPHGQLMREEQLHVEPLTMDNVAQQAAWDAATALLDSFLAHARHRDACYTATIRDPYAAHSAIAPASDHNGATPRTTTRFPAHDDTRPRLRPQAAS